MDTVTNIPDKERDAEIQASLKRMGLPEFFPVFREDRWHYDDELIACDPRGKAIVCRNEWFRHIAESFTEFYAKEIEVKILKEGRKPVVVFIAVPSLSIPERHTLAAMVRYFDSYAPGLRIDNDDDLHFPKIMSAYAAPIAFADEADAYEAAEVLHEAANLTTDVVETGEGYAVLLPNPNDQLTGFSVALIVGACYVLEQFSCTRKQKRLVEVHDEEHDSRPWREGIGKWYTQQQRIEAGINAILARLDAPEAAGRESVAPAPQDAATGAKGRGIEALIPPAPKPAVMATA